MARQQTILILSDIHYASEAEKQRRGHETRIIANPLLRRAVRAYRHYVWLRDPFAHNHLLDEFLRRADSPDWVVTNGDYSFDSRVGSAPRLNWACNRCGSSKLETTS